MPTGLPIESATSISACSWALIPNRVRLFNPCRARTGVTRYLPIRIKCSVWSSIRDLSRCTSGISAQPGDERLQCFAGLLEHSSCYIQICHDATVRLKAMPFMRCVRDFSSRNVNCHGAKIDYVLCVASGRGLTR